MILVDGNPVGVVPAADRGLQYGDGLFETLELVDGLPRRWERHMARLAEGCRRLHLPVPDPQVLRADLQRAGPPAGRAVAKILVTRGEGGRGYAAPAEARPRRILMLHPWPGHPSGLAEHGVMLRVCQTRLGTSPALGGLKHLNRLEQVLARSEWQDPEVHEGLMLDPEDRVVEGTMSNLFLVFEHRLVTPPVERSGVAGVMRGVVLELAREAGLQVEVDALRMEDVVAADEAFLTNSLIHLWPVRELAGLRQFGPPGPVSARLREAIARVP